VGGVNSTKQSTIEKTNMKQLQKITEVTEDYIIEGIGSLQVSPKEASDLLSLYCELLYIGQNQVPTTGRNKQDETGLTDNDKLELLGKQLQQVTEERDELKELVQSAKNKCRCRNRTK
jgi:hypothetical protein